MQWAGEEGGSVAMVPGSDMRFSFSSDAGSWETCSRSHTDSVGVMPTLLLMWGLIRGPLWKIQGCVWHTGNAGKHSPPLTFISLQPLRWREIIIIHPLRCCLTCGCYSVQFRCSGMSDSLRPHGLQHTRLRCPSPSPRACSNSCYRVSDAT